MNILMILFLLGSLVRMHITYMYYWDRYFDVTFVRFLILRNVERLDVSKDWQVGGMQLFISSMKDVYKLYILLT